MGKRKALDLTILRAHVNKASTHTRPLVKVFRISQECSQGSRRFHSWRLDVRKKAYLKPHLQLQWTTNYRKITSLAVMRTLPTESDRSQWERIVNISLPSLKDPCKILNLNISVLDTFPDDIEQCRETVVALHGVPGTGFDFQSLGEKLSERGIRFIAPTCLGMKLSPLDLNHLNEIDFSPQGSAKILRSVLKAMNVQRIDLLMAHSLGNWTLYEAGAYWQNVGSLLTINPNGVSPHRAMRPYLLIKFAAAACSLSVVRRIIMPLVPWVLRLKGFKDVPLKDAGSHLIATIFYSSNPNFPKMIKNAQDINLRARPLVVMYSLNDTLVEPAISANMAFKKLGIPTKNTVTYTTDKIPSQDPHFAPEGWFARCLVFTKGGHLVYLAHEDQVLDQIEDLLKHVAQKNNEDSSSNGELW